MFINDLGYFYSYIMVIDDLLDNINKSKRVKGKMILAEGTTASDIKDYVARRIEEANPVNPRKNGRKENATYTVPHGLAPIEESGKRIDPTTGRIVIEDGKTARDIATILWDEIYNHGRASVDELVKRYRGYDPNLLQIVINLMIKQKFLKTHKERKENNITTLEVVSDEERSKFTAKFESKN